MLTDEQLVDNVVRSREWQTWLRYGRWWEVQNTVRSHLRHYSWLHDGFPLEFEKTVQRVTKIIRSRNARRGAETRRRNEFKRRQLSLRL